MLRNILTAVIESAVTAEGYTFHSGFEYRINNGLLKLPAAWLLPVHIIKVDGRHDGFLTYRAELYLLHFGKKATPQTREQLWSTMEINALKILDRIGQGRQVFNLDNISCTPSENSLTPHNETALKITCDIRMRFTPADSPLDQ